MQEIKDQVNNWISSKIKSPYFGSVLAVWIVFESSSSIWSV